MSDHAFRVLFADNYAIRHGQFRVRSDKNNVVQRHCHYAGETLHAVANEIPDKQWDVIFIPGAMELAANTEEFLNAFIDKCIKRPPRLVIYHGSDDTYYTVQRLMEKGIPAAWVPWDYIDLNNHTRKMMKVKGAK